MLQCRRDSHQQNFQREKKYVLVQRTGQGVGGGGGGGVRGGGEGGRAAPALHPLSLTSFSEVTSAQSETQVEGKCEFCGNLRVHERPRERISCITYLLSNSNCTSGRISSNEE